MGQERVVARAEGTRGYGKNAFTFRRWRFSSGNGNKHSDRIGSLCFCHWNDLLVGWMRIFWAEFRKISESSARSRRISVLVSSNSALFERTGYFCDGPECSNRRKHQRRDYEPLHQFTPPEPTFLPKMFLERNKLYQHFYELEQMYTLQNWIPQSIYKNYLPFNA